MDRTIIPNGRQTEHPEAPQRFKYLCSLPEVTLVYVTGRHLELVEQAIVDYDLPHPEYAITDVGTKMYHRVENNWVEMHTWQGEIALDWNNKSHKHLQESLKEISFLFLQEREKQSNFKLSYYLPLTVDHEKILIQVEQQLSQLGVKASLIFSIDEPNQITLLDILPKNATKLHAIQFLQLHLGYGVNNTLFAGDSGNDLPVLGSSIRSILVANAEPEIKREAHRIAETNGYPECLYTAKDEISPLGGNYSAGVLQGVLFFIPELRNELALS
jgi:HAD superfamily hydrolase (TIGR01484 family)